MIAIQSNAAEVKAAFREIARLTPSVAGRVLSTVGLALRKDVVGSIQGRGPIAVAPRADLSRRLRPGRMGGRIANGIRYHKRPGRVVVGATDWAAPYFTDFQSAEVRDFTPREKGRIVRAVRPGTGYVAPPMIEKYVDKPGLTYDRPARAVIRPLAESSYLAGRIRNVATKRLAAMAKQAARKAARAR